MYYFHHFGSFSPGWCHSSFKNATQSPSAADGLDGTIIKDSTIKDKSNTLLSPAAIVSSSSGTKAVPGQLRGFISPAFPRFAPVSPSQSERSHLTGMQEASQTDTWTPRPAVVLGSTCGSFQRSPELLPLSLNWGTSLTYTHPGSKFTRLLPVMSHTTQHNTHWIWSFRCQMEQQRAR